MPLFPVFRIRFLGVLVIAAAQMGCLAPMQDARFMSADRDASGAARSFFTRALSKAHLGPKGDVIVQSAAGYCVDVRSMFHDRGSDLAVLASCHSLTNAKTGAFVPPAVILLAVDAPDFTGPSDTPLEIRAAHDGAAIGQARPYWRAVGRKSHRLVGLSLYAPNESAAKGARGRMILHSIYDKISIAVPTPPADQAPVVQPAAAQGALPNLPAPKARPTTGRTSAIGASTPMARPKTVQPAARSGHGIPAPQPRPN